MTRPNERRNTRQELRRALNAELRSKFGRPERVLALVCECGDAVCHHTILMSPDEYDAYGDHPILHPTHQT
jgi:hypothetical protein